MNLQIYPSTGAAGRRIGRGARRGNVSFSARRAERRGKAHTHRDGNYNEKP